MPRALEVPPRRARRRGGQTLRIAQLTDPHVFAAAGERLRGVDTAAALDAVIDAAAAAGDFDFALLTGDLVEHPSVRSYDRLLEFLRRLPVPVFCLPGNHDDPALMEERLNGDGVSTANFINCGRWSFILLNSRQEGEEGGRLAAAELDFLDQALARAARRHVLVCLHHQPVRIHSAWMDAMRLANAAALFEVLDRHDNVRGLAWGHIHQEFTARRNGALLLGCPSACLQFIPWTDAPQAAPAAAPAYQVLELGEDGAVHCERRPCPV